MRASQCRPWFILSFYPASCVDPEHNLSVLNYLSSQSIIYRRKEFLSFEPIIHRIPSDFFLRIKVLRFSARLNRFADDRPHHRHDLLLKGNSHISFQQD